MIDAREEIIFRDADGNEKFRIKDGESIKISTADGKETKVIRCRWLDEAYISVGAARYHIDELESLMVAIGNKYEPVVNPKPKFDVLLVEPGKQPRDMQISIDRAAAAMRRLVGEPLFMEALGPYAIKVCARAKNAQNDECGAYVICGLKGENITSLHPYTARQYKREIALRMHVDNVQETMPFVLELISE